MIVTTVGVAVRGYVVHSLLVSDSNGCTDVFSMNMAACCIYFCMIQVRVATFHSWSLGIRASCNRDRYAL